MRYLCCQPAEFYFGWQIDIMLYNFLDIGINPRDIDVVCGYDSSIDEYFDKLQKKYKDVNFHFYKDTRKDKSYSPSIQPHILYKHFSNNFSLRNEVIFYHDCDIVFTKKLDLEKYVNDDICYLSDTISYIGANYIKSKGEDVFDKMIDIVAIDRNLVIGNQPDSGGAQHILKNIRPVFWAMVERDGNNLFREITKLNIEKKKENPSYHELQIWTAGMWSLLWNLWKMGKKTKVIKELDFMFATDPIENWERKSIYHNAGVTSKNSTLFHKGSYTTSIPKKNQIVDDTKANYNYYEILKKVL